MDYCCGNGDDSFVMYRNGVKKVTGIDISEVFIWNCQKKPKERRLKVLFHL
ncbi:MAG: class I SAM-dependent methyltransferase [Candidatus Scalindua sp.]|nr:class I SAM-dependent methyltransferase [Candidatus Scalindua sp.]